MTHRAAQVVDAVAALVRARVQDAGTKVFTHRRFTLDPEQDELPAISVDYGEDRPAETRTMNALDSVLAVECTAVVASPIESELREKLLEIRAEIHRAVSADRRLGLPAFVVNTFYGGANSPAIDADGEQLVGELTSSWLVHYRMSLADPAE